MDVFFLAPDGARVRYIQGIYPISSVVHPNQTILYNCVELLDEKLNIGPTIVQEVSILISHYKIVALNTVKLIRE